MEQLIDKLIDMGMNQYMAESREELAMSDEIYLGDSKDEGELEKRYDALNLAPGHRMFINDYIACMKSAGDRYSEISYIAGIKDTLKMLRHLDMLKCNEA